MTGTLDDYPSSKTQISVTVTVLAYFKDPTDGSVYETLTYRVVNDGTKMWTFETQSTVSYGFVPQDTSDFSQVY